VAHGHGYYNDHDGGHRGSQAAQYGHEAAPASPELGGSQYTVEGGRLFCVLAAESREGLPQIGLFVIPHHARPRVSSIWRRRRLARW
jgi:hypothetical protein